MQLEERVKLARLIVALAEDDREGVVKAYTDMGVRTAKMGEGVGGGGGRKYPCRYKSTDVCKKLSTPFYTIQYMVVLLHGRV